MSKHLRQRGEERGTASLPRPDPIGQIHAVEVSSYSGPLPHPDLLRQFEEVVPGSAERILRQFEEQSSHRRRMERSVISSGAFSQRVGSISAALLGLVGVTGGIWLAHEGKSLDGLVALFGTLGSLVGTYLYQRKRQDKEREQKQGLAQSKK